MTNSWPTSNSSTRPCATASRASGACACRRGWRCRWRRCSTAPASASIDLAELVHLEVLIQVKPREPLGGARPAARRDPPHADARRHARQRLRLLRRHAGCADGPLDAPAQRARRALLLDLRRALRDRQLRPPGAVAKEFGSEVVGTVFFTISPVHTRRVPGGESGRDRRVAGARRHPLLRHRRRARRGAAAHAAADRSSPRRAASRSRSTPTT